jgi:signal transduction histidine kinase
VTTAVPSLLLRRLSRGQLFAFDALLAGAAALVGWYAAAALPASPHSGWHEPAWVSVVAGVLLGLPVALRRLRPVIAACVVLAVAGGCVATGLIPDYAGPAPTAVVGLVLYTVGANVSRRWSVATALGCIIGITLAFASVSADPLGVALVAWLSGACWAIGRTVRERRAYAARIAEQVTALAVVEERLRLTRELHDIVAHSMSMIAVKATIADHVADERPQEMRAALRVIAATSRDALSELRRALGALRTEAVLAPSPGLGDLDELVAAGWSAGLAVDLEVRGRRDLPEGVGLAVFRIVQEAVTNVVRHADATDCWIEVEVGPDDKVRIRVVDNGSGREVNRKTKPETPGQAAAGQAAAGQAAAGQDAAGQDAAGQDAPEQDAAEQDLVRHAAAGQDRSAQSAATQDRAGQGLIGMRERVTLFGGDLIAGPGPEGGWIVEATLRCTR